MATTNIINSTLLRIYVDGTAVAHATEASFSVQMSPRDVTTKDSNGWRELLEGLRQASGSVSAMYAYDAAYGASDLRTLLTGRTQATIRFTTEVSGDEVLEAEAYFTNVEHSSPGSEDNATFSASFEVTGSVTDATVT